MERMQIAVTQLLRAGVILALLLVAGGGLMYLLQHGNIVNNYSVFHGEPVQEASVNGILQSVFSLSSPRALIHLGILVLAFTQIVRIACVAWYFSKIKDYTFAGISLFVLFVIVAISLGGILR